MRPINHPLRFVLCALCVSALQRTAQAQVCFDGTCSDRVVVSRSKAISLKKNFVVQQFAVPVGVPVAPYAETYYEPAPQYQQPQQSGHLQTPRDPQSEIERLAAAMVLANDPEYKKKILAKYGPLSADRVIQDRCASCHSGTDAKANLNLSGVGVANYGAELEQKIISRLFTEDESKRMPKDGKLNRKEFEALMRAFAK